MYSGEGSSTTYRGACIRERLVAQVIEVDVIRRNWQYYLSRWMYSRGLVVQLIEVDVFKTASSTTY